MLSVPPSASAASIRDRQAASALVASPTFIPSTKAVDGTHPNAAGYAEWARVIDEWPAWRSWLP